MQSGVTEFEKPWNMQWKYTFVIINSVSFVNLTENFPCIDSQNEKGEYILKFRVLYNMII